MGVIFPGLAFDKLCGKGFSFGRGAVRISSAKEEIAEKSKDCTCIVSAIINQAINY